MKNKHYKRIIMLFSVFIMLSILKLNAFASESDIQLVFSANEAKHTVSVFIPSPDKLTDIDISVFCNGNLVSFSDISTENTDTDSFSSIPDSFPDNAENEQVYFTYLSDVSPEKIVFSGYFPDTFTSEKDLHLFDFIITPGESFSEKDTITAVCKYTTNGSVISFNETYFIKSGKLTDSKKASQYPLGDADLNGTVSASDARSILRASVGLQSLDFSAVPYADTNYDGIISAKDARYALRASVELEEKVMHNFEISLNDGASCESGGKYTFRCVITEIEFTMEIKDGRHLKEDSSCFDTGKCRICHKTVFPTSGHIFDENGFCTSCGAEAEMISEAESKLIPLLENVSYFDSLAHEALDNNNKADFIRNTQLATAEIKKAVKITEGINGLQSINTHLKKAYQLRFEAFIQCTDENGQIRINSANCKTILNAVNNSNSHIDYASYLNIG